MSEDKTAPDKVTIPLSKPIKAHGEDLSQLELRAPTGEDVLEIGAPPFTVDTKNRTNIDMAVTGEYIVRLAGIPLSSVRQMTPQDLMVAFGVVAGFFGDTAKTRKKSSADTTS